MKKGIKKTLEAVCVTAFFLALLFCENADGTLNAAFTLPMLALSGVSGYILKRDER